jgi:hypothetical protein
MMMWISRGLGKVLEHQYRPWFDEGYSKLSDERKGAKTAVVTGYQPNKWR